jgi:hypothetical protein
LSHDAYIKFIEDIFLNGQRIDPNTDGRPDPRLSVREKAAQLGDIAKEFDFSQAPLAPLILPERPYTPTANAGGPYSILINQSLTLNGSGSFATDGDPLTYGWKIVQQQGYGQASGVMPTLTWSQLQALGVKGGQTYQVSVQVSDNEGYSNISETTTLTVANHKAGQAADTIDQPGIYVSLARASRVEPGYSAPVDGGQATDQASYVSPNSRDRVIRYDSKATHKVDGDYGAPPSSLAERWLNNDAYFWEGETSIAQASAVLLADGVLSPYSVSNLANPGKTAGAIAAFRDPREGAAGEYYANSPQTSAPAGRSGVGEATGIITLEQASLMRNSTMFDGKSHSPGGIVAALRDPKSDAGDLDDYFAVGSNEGGAAS